mgnify:CR=1 FL=1
MKEIRHTKIIATLGPATDDPRVMRDLLAAGVDVVRINFSHGNADDQRRRVEMARAAAESLGRDLGVLGDLQGPKIRVESFRDGPIELQDGDTFTLDPDLPADAGTQQAVSVSYAPLASDVTVGDVLLLNDGAIELKVAAIEGNAVHCTVTVGGRLSDRKGLNRLGGGLTATALTDKDLEDIKLASELQVDFLAVSFPRDAGDLARARELLIRAGLEAWIVAKIERAEAIDNLEDIIRASETVMVARGDLGVEIGDAELPAVQKRIIADSREYNRVVVTATQMMESMIQNPLPTRAEVLDVANAVMDGTDAVMLSAETATGRYPVKAVEAMHRVCIGAERQHTVARSSSLSRRHFRRTDEAIAMAAIYTADNMGADAILALTESGTTPMWMSRAAARIPIYALTPHERTRRRMTLCRGVTPIAFAPDEVSGAQTIIDAIACLRERGLLEPGERVLVTKGDLMNPGGTNTLKIVTITD